MAQKKPIFLHWIPGLIAVVSRVVTGSSLQTSYGNICKRRGLKQTLWAPQKPEEESWPDGYPIPCKTMLSKAMVKKDGEDIWS